MDSRTKWFMCFCFFPRFLSEHIYTTKIIESVYMYVCMSGYAFRYALRYRAETWYGGRGWAQEVCGHIFEVTSPR